MLSLQDIEYFYNQYAPHPNDDLDVRLAPLVATDLANMPPSFIAVAEYDPLCHEGQIFAAKLDQAGVNTTLYIAQGLLHGGLKVFHQSEEAQYLYQKIKQSIQNMLLS